MGPRRAMRGQPSNPDVNFPYFLAKRHDETGNSTLERVWKFSMNIPSGLPNPASPPRVRSGLGSEDPANAWLADNQMEVRFARE